MIAKYLEYTTSVHSQIANYAFLSHTLSCFHSWQQQLLNFDKYVDTHTMNYQPLQIYLHHMTMIMWFTRFGKRDPAESVKHKINLVWPYCSSSFNRSNPWIYCYPISNIAELLKESRFRMWQLFICSYCIYVVLCGTLL